MLAWFFSGASLAHDWADEIDHFHAAEAEQAFETLEPLSARGELRIDAATIAPEASAWAFGFAMALQDWAGRHETPEPSAPALAGAVAAIEVLAVMLDANEIAGNDAKAAALRSSPQMLANSDSAADAFRIAYGYRLRSVSSADRKAAARFAERFSRLRSQVLEKRSRR